MRVLFLTEGTRNGTSPASRYRVWQYLPYLERDGIRCIVRPIIPTKYYPYWIGQLHRYPRRAIIFGMWVLQFFSRFIDIIDSSKFDRVFIQRDLTPILAYPLHEKLCTSLNHKVIFDFDDAIFVNVRQKLSLPFLFNLIGAPLKIDNIISWSNKVIVGNSYLRNYAIQFNRNVTIIPTPIDTRLIYNKRKNYSNTKTKLVVGWSGTSGGLVYLKEIIPSLKAVAKNHNIVLRIISDSIAGFNEETLGIDIQFKKWKANTEVDDILDFDIGIMPLPDNDFTRGKCGFKALQYMACGIPTILSPVGVNSEIVVHGENGLLASNLNDWESCLSLLVDNPELIMKLGLSGRKTVEERYSVNSTYPLLLSCLQSS